MAQDRNTYAKRQRETAKRQKAEDKRARRQKRKDSTSVSANSEKQPAIEPTPGGSDDP